MKSAIKNDGQYIQKVKDLEVLRDQVKFLGEQQKLNEDINTQLSDNTKKYSQITAQLEVQTRLYELNEEKIALQTELLDRQGEVSEKQLEIETFLDREKGRTVRQETISRWS